MAWRINRLLISELQWAHPRSCALGDVHLYSLHTCDFMNNRTCHVTVCALQLGQTSHWLILLLARIGARDEERMASACIRCLASVLWPYLQARGMLFLAGRHWRACCVGRWCSRRVTNFKAVSIVFGVLLVKIFSGIWKRSMLSSRSCLPELRIPSVDIDINYESSQRLNMLIEVPRLYSLYEPQRGFKAANSSGGEHRH